jgi:hypothetical protein
MNDSCVTVSCGKANPHVGQSTSSIRSFCRDVWSLEFLFPSSSSRTRNVFCIPTTDSIESGQNCDACVGFDASVYQLNESREAKGNTSCTTIYVTHGDPAT